MSSTEAVWPAIDYKAKVDCTVIDEQGEEHYKGIVVVGSTLKDGQAFTAMVPVPEVRECDLDALAELADVVEAMIRDRLAELIRDG